MTIGERIQLKREELGLSQTELAKRMGYASKSAVSRSENSGNDIGANRIVKFAEALHTTPAYLMGWEDTDEYKQGQADAMQLDLQLFAENPDTKIKELFGEDFLCLREISKLSPEARALLKQQILSILKYTGIDVSQYSE